MAVVSDADLHAILSDRPTLGDKQRSIIGLVTADAEVEVVVDRAGHWQDLRP